MQNRLVRSTLTLAVLLKISSCSLVTVETPIGEVTGIASSEVESFLGIRFATIDERFSVSTVIDTPQQPINATSFGSWCYQENSNNLNQDEDCLYLNIWRPKTATPGPALTTMVWIHGGSYNSGSGASKAFRGYNLAREHNVIVVTINYRLGMFGFLVTGPNGQGGLNGVHDQINALIWVRNNIQYFGGNPNDVVIFGESAGSGCVCMLSVSPLAKGLFHRAIMQSGDCVFGITSPAEADNILTAPEGVLNTTGAHDITDLIDSTKFPAADIASNVVFPTVDGWVLPQHPKHLYQNSKNVIPMDMLAGSNSYDDMFYLNGDGNVSFAFLVPSIPELKPCIEALFQEKYGTAAVNRVLEAYSPTNYYNNEEAARAQLSGDFLFRCPEREFAALLAEKLAGHMYLYNFEHLSELDSVISSGVYEKLGINDETWASHYADVAFIFGFVQSADDTVFSVEMMARWANFAKNGNPNTKNYTGWTPVPKESVSRQGSATAVPAFLIQTGGGVMDNVEKKVTQCSTFPNIAGQPDADSFIPVSSYIPAPFTQLLHFNAREICKRCAMWGFVCLFICRKFHYEID